jgi:hypothetical protein
MRKAETISQSRTAKLMNFGRDFPDSVAEIPPAFTLSRKC